MSENNLSYTRNIKLKKNLIALFGIKGISMLISFLYVPLLYNGLDENSYAVWLTLTSLVSWVSMFDIGLGNGLRNRLAEALAKDDKELGKTYVSTAYGCILCIVIVFFAIFLITYKYISWDKVLNANSINILELNILVLIVFTTFLINFILNLINSILYAIQLPALSYLVSMLGQLLSYILVFVCVKVLDISSLLILGTLVSASPSIVLLVSSMILFKNRHKDISPSLSYIDTSKIKDILSLGIKFFFIQISTIVLFSTNNLIITHVVNDKAVVEYNIAYKYMHILIMIFNIIATPLWSATTDAYTRGDIMWIKKICKKLKIVVVLMTFAGLIMLCFSRPIYKLWIGSDELTVNLSTTLLLYLYSVAMMMYGCYGYIINGIGKLNIQIIMTCILSVVYIPLAIFWGEQYGLMGVLLAFVITTFCNYVWAKLQYHKLMSGTASGIWNN